MSDTKDGRLVSAYLDDVANNGGESKQDLPSYPTSSMASRAIVSCNDITQKIFAQRVDGAGAPGPPGTILL